MRSIYDSILAGGASAVAKLWEDKTQESLQLEFKQKANGSHGQPEAADYHNLSKTLSAFANSAGGLLVWGVRTEKHGKGEPDAASKGAAIANLPLFASEMRRAVGESLMPRHDGIEVHEIQDPQMPGTGYLAIWIERSERRPHRAERAAERYYFKRSGSSTFAMEHYDVEDAFNRMGAVDLELVRRKTIAGVPTRSQQSNWETQNFTLRFSLKNDSRLSAAAAYVWLEDCRGAKAQRAVISPPSQNVVVSGFSWLRPWKVGRCFSAGAWALHPSRAWGACFRSSFPYWPLSRKR